VLGRITIIDLWVLRTSAAEDLQQHYAMTDAAKAAGATVFDLGKLERLTDIAYNYLLDIDWRIIRTKPKNLVELAMQAKVLEGQICNDDGNIDEDFLRTYCSTVRSLAADF